jgi:putative modified peptide
MSAFKLPAPIIDRLLDRLGNDDDFRDLFVADTRAALAGLGFEPAADPSVKMGLWECLFVDRLASKETLRASRDTLRTQLLLEFVFVPFLIGCRESMHEAVA